MSSYLDQDLAIDITVAFPQAAVHVHAAARTAGAAATHLESHKYRTYGAICTVNNIALKPLGIDAYGALGRDGTDFLRQLSLYNATRFASLPHEEEHLLHARFTVALHTLQARMIYTRLATS